MNNIFVWTGVDIVYFYEIEKIISTVRGKHKFFTEKEIEYCESKIYPEQHYAGRFAAKEAILKSLGIGILDGYSIKDIEILNLKSGKPKVNLKNNIGRYVADIDILDMDISISHSRDIAISTVVIVGKSRTKGV